MGKLEVKTKIILRNGENSFGPGICELLEHIRETGSIRAAAAHMNLSYKKAWNMINHAEEETGFSFLERVNGGKKGGSSTLTEKGIQFVKGYRQLEAKLQKLSEDCFASCFAEFLIPETGSAKESVKD